VEREKMTTLKTRYKLIISAYLVLSIPSVLYVAHKVVNKISGYIKNYTQNSDFVLKVQNIIYTLYQSSQTDDEVLRFAEQHESVKAITMWSERASAEFVEALSFVLNPLLYCNLSRTPIKEIFPAVRFLR
jgi:hypothetical protein